MMYSCLWRYRDVALAHQVEEWFTVPELDMSAGCKKLRPLEDPTLGEMKQCLCEEWDAVDKLEQTAAVEAKKAEAAEKLEKAKEAFQEKEVKAKGYYKGFRLALNSEAR